MPKNAGLDNGATYCVVAEVKDIYDNSGNLIEIFEEGHPGRNG